MEKPSPALRQCSCLPGTKWSCGRGFRKYKNNRGIEMLRALSIFLLLVFLSTTSLSTSRAATIGGDEFVTATSGNTLSGIGSYGQRYYLYFLPGGSATYQDVAGGRDIGTWHLSPQGEICVAWRNLAPPLRSGCYSVSLSGRRMNWTAKSATIQTTLQGGVVDAAELLPYEGHRHPK